LKRVNAWWLEEDELSRIERDYGVTQLPVRKSHNKKIPERSVGAQDAASRISAATPSRI
jgi:hypothetical protein